ncbi:MAG: Asp-tRNA(Asn)/Glu-tRNA(Gln) amidotransferase subunit GatA [Planctomycetota bacterium]|nr:MAG: Asp-tRNA(Asn)/Glu-tRNA(Gln) amidotransferase subunit GatA [Planctomycetota bacterium]
MLELAADVRARRTNAVAAAEQALARLEKSRGALNAVLAVDRDGALARARELDRRSASGTDVGPLAGVPFALKANMCLAGVEANCASRVLAGYKPPYTATFVQRLLDAGANPIAITNMDEFAMGSSGENSAYGTTKNPWDLARTPGGSSSGSAALVAAGVVPFALGSDTGGSVRQPAALSNLAGYKPTYGRISRYGLIAFASSLDQVSPFARSVADVELVTRTMCGHDERDTTSLPEPAFDAAPDADSLRGLRIGVPDEYFPATLDAAVRARTEEALAVLERAGAQLVRVSLPHSEHAIATYYVVATAEASSNLARYDGVRYGPRAAGDGSLQSMYAATRAQGFGDEVKRRILLGTYVLSSGYYDAWYRRALKVRTLLLRDFERAFERCDIVAGPTSPTAAFKLGEKSDDPVAMYLSDVLTVPASLAGLPALSLPCGFVADGASRLPIGLQLIGPARADARVLALGRHYQKLTAFHGELAPLAHEVAA